MPSARRNRKKTKLRATLTYGGNFCSLVIIYLLNLAVLSIFLIAASRGLTRAGFGQELLAQFVQFTACVIDLLRLRTCSGGL